MSTSLTLQPAVEFTLPQLCDLINRSFAGYVGGEINFTPPVMANFIAQGDVHLGRSLVALSGDLPAGIAMLARRGWTARVALMGVVPDFQNQGVGRWLLGQIVDEARQHGDKTLTLEVIEQNPRAVHLYESCGYRKLRRLMGYTGENLTGVPAELALTRIDSSPLVRIDSAEAARRIVAWQPDDMPWQLSGESLVTFGPPVIGYRMGECYAVISNPDADNVTIWGLAVPPEHQRKGLATRLVAALIASHPDKTWHVAPICPEEYGAVFTRNGFTVKDLNQFQMELRLD